MELYPTHSNNELCQLLEKTEGQIRGMKERLKLNTKFNPLTDEEKLAIKNFYMENPYEIDVEGFSKKLGRAKVTIERYARKLGLTNYKRPLSQNTKEKMKESLKKYRKSDLYIINKERQKELLSHYLNNNHPKGMLGKHHSEETRKKLSLSHIELFKNMSDEEKHKRAMKSVETKRKKGGFSTTTNAYSRCKGGIREDLNQYFRSAWEANIARVLNYLDVEWKYEYKRFNFENEFEGILSYQPDFYLPKYDKWIEVKGWMDEKSKIRLTLFKKYYPIESSNLFLIDEKEYKNIEKQYSNLINNWEYKNNYKVFCG